MNSAAGFSKIEFLLILISIVYGYCVVDLFENWGRMLRRNVYYWETIVWSVILFLSIAFLWHNAWENVGKIAEGALYYVFALLPPIFFFIMTSLLFPDRTSEWALETTFMKNRSRFFLIFACVIAMIAATGFLTGLQKPLVNYTRTFFSIGALVNAWVDNKLIRLSLALLAFIWFCYLLMDYDLSALLPG